jgi:uncharacterized protein (DUF2236 family)
MPHRPTGPFPSLLQGALARTLKDTISAQVVALFNDRSRGERPVVPRLDGLFGPHAVAWRGHSDVTSMMVGGVAGLLLQMLHPAVLAGVWDHSNFRADMHGRLRRTARFIAVTTFGHRDRAEAAIGRVKAIHEQVSGMLPDGTGYRATDPWLLAWVHVAGAVNFLDGWRRYAEPRMSSADQDRYFAESGEIARLLDADPVPRTRAEAERLIRQFQAELRADQRTRTFRDLVLKTPSRSFKDAPVQMLLMNAAVDLMPPFARKMHGLSRPILPPVLRGATYGIASTLRWAFAGEHYRRPH